MSGVFMNLHSTIVFSAMFLYTGNVGNHPLNAGAHSDGTKLKTSCHSCCVWVGGKQGYIYLYTVFPSGTPNTVILESLCILVPSPYQGDGNGAGDFRKQSGRDKTYTKRFAF